LTLSQEDANQLAALLNQVCSATIAALTSGSIEERLMVVASLREFRGQFDAESEVGSFVDILLRWLEGTRPAASDGKRLQAPFRRALTAMLEQVPEPQKSGSGEEQEPVSRHVLAQLITAVVAAEASGNVEVQRALAAQLVNTRAQLDSDWQKRLGPLLDNLRSVLGGADPRTLPVVPDPTYQRLWLGAAEILINADLREEVAVEQLLARLTHNTLFVARAKDPELTEGFLRSLVDVQRQALASGASGIATLIAAIRTHLQGLDATPFSTVLEGDELDAWKAILEGMDGTSNASPVD
jgi:hypothetical protein